MTITSSGYRNKQKSVTETWCEVKCMGLACPGHFQQCFSLQGYRLLEVTACPLKAELS
jgi:hypothetical protein